MTKTTLRLTPRRSTLLAFGVALALGLAPACGDDDEIIVDAGGYIPDAGDEDDAGTDDGGAPEPPSFGGLIVDTSWADQGLDLFGVPGHRIWVEVSREQLDLMNEAGGGGIIVAAHAEMDLARAAAADFIGPIDDGDIYTPGAPGGDKTYADHFVVQDAMTQSVADYGKVEARLVGESTFRQWNKRRIPNLRIDADEFEKDKRIGTFEHIRLNNSLVGSIFREHIAHRIYRALDYPALRSSFAFLGSNVWGDDVWVPMTLIEVYKKRFCRDHADLIGGECVNMWEFAGDLGDRGGVPGPGFPIDGFDEPLPRPMEPGEGEAPRVPDEWCQVSECDNARMIELMDAIAATPAGPGFKDALASFIDWDRFHQFQCLSWIMWTGDDPIHNTNNNLIMERDDGKFVWAPYSIDISAGQDWYVNVPLTGTNVLATGCQLDPDCWADTIAACEDLIVRFGDLSPETIVDETVTTLTDLDMMRLGDEARAEELRQWYVWRKGVLASELEVFRYLPDAEGNCPMGLELCGDGGCGTSEQCAERQCSFGSVMCESLGRCITPQYEECPSCDDATPVYCEWTQACVADLQACMAACEETPGYVWCPDWNTCSYEQDCPSGGGDDDGGIIFWSTPQ